MNIVEVFENKSINLIHHPDNGKVYLDLKETAIILDVSEKTIMRHLTNHEDEFVEDEDYARVQYLNSRSEARLKRVLYPEGFILMTMFVRSEVAVRARKWAKKTLVRHIVNMQEQNPLLALRDVVDQLILQDERQKALENKVEIIDNKFENEINSINKSLEEVKKGIEDEPITEEQAKEYYDLVHEIAMSIVEVKGEKFQSVVIPIWIKAKNIGKSTEYKKTRQKYFPDVVKYLKNLRDRIIL